MMAIILFILLNILFLSFGIDGKEKFNYSATKLGIPNFTYIHVSGTHVLTGYNFGVSIFRKKHDAKVFREIVLASILTLPISLLLSIFSYFCLAIS